MSVLILVVGVMFVVLGNTPGRLIGVGLLAFLLIPWLPPRGSSWPIPPRGPRVMFELVAAVALALGAASFSALRRRGAGANGTFNSSYGPNASVRSPKESTAWIVKGVRFRDGRTADPPDATISQLPRHGIVVFAVIYQSAAPTGRRIDLRLAHATRHPCCDGTYVAGGEYGLAGAGPDARRIR